MLHLLALLSPLTASSVLRGVYLPIKHGVEGRHLVHAHGRHAADLCHLIHGRQRQKVAALPLCQVQEGDDARHLIVFGVFAEDHFDYFVVLLGEIKGAVFAIVQVVCSVLQGQAGDGNKGKEVS